MSKKTRGRIFVLSLWIYRLAYLYGLQSMNVKPGAGGSNQKVEGKDCCMYAEASKGTNPSTGYFMDFLHAEERHLHGKQA